MCRPVKASSYGRCALVWGILLLCGGLGGCGTTRNRSWWCIDNCATIPKGAIPLPAGTHLSCINAGQHERAQAEKLYVYKHEWYLDKTEPGPDGRRHLAAISRMLNCVPPDWPVVVQPVEPEEEEVVSFEATANLNEQRRQKVVEYLLEHGHPEANERVILGYPTAEGLYGDPAALIGGRYMFTQGGLGVGGAAGGGLGGGLGGGMGGGMMMGGGGFY
ncbi:MAG: hypothetical protein ACLP7Q_00500 [Isosphaeraceae bacterium]